MFRLMTALLAGAAAYGLYLVFKKPITDRQWLDGRDPSSSKKRDRVTVASDDSFPASDPPAWTGAHSS